ncbi:MAG: hypothetical protein IPH69_05955 [Bacteroidales bacterium]|nr:hypothetical protein [Bacteroidales bacterium]MBK7627403.1 hypothetical protein [Bacteroidales bacterium]
MKPTFSKSYFTGLLSGLFRSREVKDEAQLSGSETKSVSSADKDKMAAVAMALYLYFNEMHDEESNVITIQRISKTYSPWSSKIYNMRNFR